MSVPQFTPGPWLTNCSHIYAPDGAIIAVVHNPGSKATDYPLVPNRDLMAAAPELYEALANAREWLAGFIANAGRHADEELAQADAALAKARGDQ